MSAKAEAVIETQYVLDNVKGAFWREWILALAHGREAVPVWEILGHLHEISNEERTAAKRWLIEAGVIDCYANITGKSLRLPTEREFQPGDVVETSYGGDEDIRIIIVKEDGVVGAVDPSDGEVITDSAFRQHKYKPTTKEVRICDKSEPTFSETREMVREFREYLASMFIITGEIAKKYKKTFAPYLETPDADKDS